MAGDRRRRIDEIGDESRRRILDAAEELFGEKGFDRTSFVDIAERSGISRGSIPWHFQNKDGLLIAVVERVVERNMARSSQVDEVASFHVIVDEVLGMLQSTSHPMLMFMILTEAMTGRGLVHEQYVEFFRSRRKGLAQWVAASQADGRRRTPTELKALGAVLNGALLGIQFQWELDRDSVNLEASLTALADLVEAGLGIAPAAKRPSAKSR